MDDKFDFPVYAIYGDEYFEEDLQELVEIQFAIGEIHDDINETNQKLEDVGAKLNFYINNIIEMEEKFDYKNNLIIFSEEGEDDKEVLIYEREFVNNHVEELVEEYGDKWNEEHYDEIMDEVGDIILPNTDKRYNVNDKQYQRLNDLVDEYNNLFNQYEYYAYELNVHYADYDEILSEVKESIANISLMEVHESGTELEKFDEDRHELLITKDRIDNKWKFIYLNKENKEEFLQEINKHK